MDGLIHHRLELHMGSAVFFCEFRDDLLSLYHRIVYLARWLRERRAEHQLQVWIGGPRLANELVLYLLILVQRYLFSVVRVSSGISPAY